MITRRGINDSGYGEIFTLFLTRYFSFSTDDMFKTRNILNQTDIATKPQ